MKCWLSVLFISSLISCMGLALVARLVIPNSISSIQCRICLQWKPKLFKSEHLCLQSINYSFLYTRTSQRNRPAGVRWWRLYDNRCVWVWTESCSIFANVLRRSVPHERIPAWLPVERQSWGSERGNPLWQVACRPSSHTTRTAQNNTWLLYTCTLELFQPAAQLVFSTGSQEHALGDKHSEGCTCKPSHWKQAWNTEVVNHTAELKLLFALGFFL